MRHYGQFDGITWLARGVRLAVVGGAVCLVPAASQLAGADDIAASVVEDASRESSVLVATRKLHQDNTNADEASEGLQPISTLAEKEPQLADPELAPMPHESTSDSNAPVKVASNTSEVDTSLAPKVQSPQPAVFHSMQPGVSTKKQLVDAWGSPDEVAPTDTGELLTFNLESFRGVEVLIEDGVVSLMRIELRAPSAPSELAEKVQADPREAVQVIDDESGHVAAYAYPERGIVMVLDAPNGITPDTSERVSQMILQPLDADTFCLRSEARPFSEFAHRIADLKQAAKLAPRDARTHWLLSRALLDAGRASDAEVAAKRAVDIDPENMMYRLQWGTSLAAIGKYDSAVLATREVLDAEEVPTLIRGKALHDMGKLASMGDSGIAEKAVGFHSMAIAEADKLATASSAADRREAKRLLVEAHLAIAVEISKREYNDKMDNVAQWVSRASAFAEEMIANDNGDLGLRIRVAQQSLAALANFKPANDPEPLLQEIEETLDEIKAEEPDPLYIEQLEWNTGIAYLSALQIEHHRRRPKQALEYSDQAIKLLADQAEERRDDPQTEQLVGKLYFHIGAVHAVHESAHAEAVEWYDRAFPLLVADAPESELVVPRHEGEALVSMAVSYWDQNDHKQAISLTEMGADLIEQAVTGGVIDKQNLSVPYGNLAVMHKKLGNTSESQRYAKLADSIAAAAETTPAQASDAKAQEPGVARAKRSTTSQTAQRIPTSSQSRSASPQTKQRTPTPSKQSNRTYRR